MGRAFDDGFAAYHREDGSKVWREKMKFVLLEPFMIIDRETRGCEGSRAHELFWTIREAGRLHAHFHKALFKG